MRILVIEDDKALSMVLSEILNQDGYTADTVFDGEKGLDCAVTGIYDVIILDVMLPRMDGLTVLQNMRSSGCSTPVLLLSAKSQIEDKVKGLDFGADDYLTKPFNSSELLARVRVLSRRRASEIIGYSDTFGDVTLIREKHEISKGNKKVKLTKKEFDILEIMIRNKGTVISKETLILKIWGYDTDIEYNSTEVYVSFLRKKLKAIGSDLKITTIRSVGYLLEKFNADST